MSDKEKGIKKEKVNWFLQLITLGDRFSWRDFYDRLKKVLLTFPSYFLESYFHLGLNKKV